MVAFRLVGLKSPGEKAKVLREAVRTGILEGEEVR